MPRYPPSGYSYAIGPGGITPAIKILLIANTAMFIAGALSPQVQNALVGGLGLNPSAVVTQLALWQPITYMFLHADVFHILFNMLALWMFGVELERMWGTPFFVKYYAITGVGAGLFTIALSLLPTDWSANSYYVATIGASGAIYGLLLAYGLSFPNRPIYLYFLFQIPAKYFVMIVGAIAFLSSISNQPGGTSHAAHLGGLLVGYFYLRGRKLKQWNPMAELKYRYLRWKIARMRRKFDVFSGGRSNDWDKRVH
jgi:membrane associated rhomboid family serine protease